MKELLERKARAGRALALSVACLKLELPDQVFQDHYAAVQEFLDADAAVAEQFESTLDEVHEKLRLVRKHIEAQQIEEAGGRV